MTTFIATSDLHGNLKNLEPFKISILKALREAKTHHCPLFIGGDLNDTKAILRAEVVQFLIEAFSEFKDVLKVILVGNHDLINHFSSTDHSLDFLKSLPNTEVIDTPREVFSGWYAIPYYHKNEEILEQLNLAKAKGFRKILLHQGVMGAKQSEYILDKSSISLEDLSGFDSVLTGHYHSHQVLGNVTYFGSPFTVSFAEANQDKFIWLVEDDGFVKMTPIRTGARKHIQVTWEESLEDSHTIPGHTKDDIIKIVARGSKEFCLSINKEDIKKKFDIDNLQIVTEIAQTKKSRIQASTIHKPMEVINSYLETAETSLDKNELKKYLGKVCHEDN